jgi:hypothetical protein
MSLIIAFFKLIAIQGDLLQLEEIALKRDEEMHQGTEAKKEIKIIVRRRRHQSRDDHPIQPANPTPLPLLVAHLIQKTKLRSSRDLRRLLGGTRGLLTTETIIEDFLSRRCQFQRHLPLP